MIIMVTTLPVLTDRYQIEELLSQKAGRRTFLATDLQDQVPVIIKLLRFGDDFQWDDLKLFEREAATLKNLDHSDIPKYLDYFEVDETDNSGFALVQSYIEAPSLATLIARGCKFSEAEIIELADRLLDLLTYLHQQHPPVIHRDIKPSNILLGNRSGHSIGDVYLVDFGSVQTVAKKEEGTITIVGSYGYIPLEQFGGQTTTASDLYSLGMTLIYLLTGTHPAELAQINGQVTFKADISKQFERWLKRMIHPHLDKRFESATAAQHALKFDDSSDRNCNQLKPANTQIRLHRDKNRLQITWQHADQTDDHSCQGCILSFTFLLIFISFPGLMLLLILLGCLGYIILGSLFSIGKASFPKNIIRQVSSPERINSCPVATYHIVIDDRRIYASKEAAQDQETTKLSWHSRSQIELLAYNPGYTFDKCLDTTGKLVRGKAITIPPKLYLYCGEYEYSFPSRFSSAKFSQAELWWLGQELSDFLNLELQVIYPTPKVPPQQTCGGGC